MQTYYEILGVPRTASEMEITKAYRLLVAKYHPDRHQENVLEELAQEKHKQLNVAYEVLSDPKSRSRYDTELRLGGMAHGSAPGPTRSGISPGTILRIVCLALVIPILMRVLHSPKLVALVVGGFLVIWIGRRLLRGMRKPH